MMVAVPAGAIVVMMGVVLAMVVVVRHQAAPAGIDRAT